MDPSPLDVTAALDAAKAYREAVLLEEGPNSKLGPTLGVFRDGVLLFLAALVGDPGLVLGLTEVIVGLSGGDTSAHITETPGASEVVVAVFDAHGREDTVAATYRLVRPPSREDPTVEVAWQPVEVSRDWGLLALAHGAGHAHRARRQGLPWSPQQLAEALEISVLTPLLLCLCGSGRPAIDCCGR